MSESTTTSESANVNELDLDTLVLTTKDNPYNPKTDYDKWKSWDEDNGYETEAYVARLLSMEEDFDIDDEIVLDTLTDKVVTEILEHDVLNVYVLV